MLIRPAEISFTFNGPVTVSRADLYRQVWDKPMNRLALDYGISGNGLGAVATRW